MTDVDSYLESGHVASVEEQPERKRDVPDLAFEKAFAELSDQLESLSPASLEELATALTAADPQVAVAQLLERLTNEQEALTEQIAELKEEEQRRAQTLDESLVRLARLEKAQENYRPN